LPRLEQQAKQLGTQALGCISVSRASDHLELRLQGRLIARVYARRAVLVNGRVVSGYFLAHLGPWSELRDTLARHEPDIAAATGSGGLLTAFPRSLGDVAQAAGFLASARLRTERELAYGHAVEVACRGLTCRFEPVVLRGGRPETRVRLRGDDDTWLVDAALVLTADADPLPLRVHADRAGIAGYFWVLSLTLFAELTCPERMV
jgi:hypothetical protein